MNGAGQISRIAKASFIGYDSRYERTGARGRAELGGILIPET